MNAFLIPLLVLAMVGTLGVLVWGLVGMARADHDPARSNRLMRWRVVLQAVSLLLALALISLMRS